MSSNTGDAGTFALGGDVSVNRLGFGGMRITGPNIMGEPRDADKARRVLLRAVELGVMFIDTAHALWRVRSDEAYRFSPKHAKRSNASRRNHGSSASRLPRPDHAKKHEPKLACDDALPSRSFRYSLQAEEVTGVC